MNNKWSLKKVVRIIGVSCGLIMLIVGFYNSSTVINYILTSTDFLKNTLVGSHYSCNSLPQSLQVETAWGKETITDVCVIKFINTSMMQRLAGIDQSGPQSYFGVVPHFSRLDHCIGVYLLLRRAGVSHKEQLAGLGHDGSHTVFSHLGDILFGNGDGAKSYQDGIHIDYLGSYKDVRDVLAEYGYTVEEMDPDHAEYTALECSLPDLCADRIQYIIHTGVLLKLITKEQALEIVNDLEFKDGRWFFHTTFIAHRFASISLHCLQALWGSHENMFFYLLFKHILVRALELKIVTAYDLHYSTDQKVLNILAASDDFYIQRLLKYASDWKTRYEVVAYDESDIHYKIKFRGVNPLVLTQGKLNRLTDIDLQYAQEYEKEKEWCARGYGIKLLCDFEIAQNKEI